MLRMRAVISIGIRVDRAAAEAIKLAANAGFENASSSRWG